MATDPKPEPEKTPATTEPPTAEEVEAKYWDTHKEKTIGILNEWFETKRKELQQLGTSRAGGRTTLPGIIANMMFGPEKKD